MKCLVCLLCGFVRGGVFCGPHYVSGRCATDNCLVDSVGLFCVVLVSACFFVVVTNVVIARALGLWSTGWPLWVCV